MKKLFALLLAAAILTALPFAASAAEADTGEIQAGDILCFGTPDEASGFDGRWLVLDPAHTSTGEGGIFLISLSLIGAEDGGPLLFRDIGDVTVSFSDRGEAYAATHPGCLDYQGSDIQEWCAAFPERYLSEAERQALIPTFKSDAGIAIPGFGIPLPGAAAGTVDFDPVENILDGDTVFLLSAEEATSAAYGFGEDENRIALYKGVAAGYWLRSPHIPTFPLDVGFVFYFGSVMDYPVNANAMFKMDTYARPACNLDGSQISELEKIGASDTASVWRVSFGGEKNERTYDTSLPEIKAGMSLQGILKTGLIVFSLVLIAVLALIVWLVTRIVKKRKNRRPTDKT